MAHDSLVSDAGYGPSATPLVRIRSILSMLPVSPAQYALITNAGSLVGATIVTSALGFVYWLVAARLFPSTSVGLASASISAMLLLGALPVLGLQTLVIGELPFRRGQEAPLIATSLALALGSGAALGLLFAGTAPLVATDFRPLSASVESVVLFALGVGLTAMTLVVDQALIGLLRGDIQLGRNVLFATAKLLALVATVLWTSRRLGLTIYATWIVGNLISLGALAGLAGLKGHWKAASLPHWSALRGLGRAAVGHQALNLAIGAPVLILPVAVTVLLSARMNAYFYTAWMMAGLIFIGPEALGIVLYAMGGRDRAGLARTVRLTLGLALGVGLLGNCVTLLGANQVLSLFGNGYPAHAAQVLRIVSLGVFPLIIKQHYIAIARISGRLTGATLLMAAGACLEVAVAGVGATLGGLTGLSLGWVLGLSGEAALVWRPVYQTATRVEVHPHPSNAAGRSVV